MTSHGNQNEQHSLLNVSSALEFKQRPQVESKKNILIIELI